MLCAAIVDLLARPGPISESGVHSLKVAQPQRPRRGV